VARNLCSKEELQDIHKKMETELGHQHGYVDAIYYCPHHPDKGYPEENPAYKITCRCRKPDNGMLEEAASDYHIDCSQSYMIGDSERDIIAGKKAGATTVGVMTGKGLAAATTLPDYFFRNVAEAVDFILDDPYRWLMDDLLINYQKSNDRPFVVVIGGNTRSGKSTLSTYLLLSLEKEGYSVQTIGLDNWILPREKRLPEYDVFQRFQWERLVQDLTNLFEGEEVIAPGYSHHPEREAKSTSYRIGNEDVLIVEGVVALRANVLRHNAHLKIFMDIDDDKLKQSLFDFYRWKGRNDDYIENLYQSRKQDEYDIIKQDRGQADIITNAKGDIIQTFAKSDK
jgi:histidinol-phosphate phosphatase family protein